MPYLIITNGSTGSGKSSLVGKVIDHCKLEKRHTRFLIDDLVENNEEYKKGVDEIIEEVCAARQLCPALRTKLRDPDDDIIRKFKAAYSHVRSGNYCGGEGTCEDLLNAMLKNAAARGENMVFETTGGYYVDWLVDQMPPHYKIYYAFTLVDFCENMRRNNERAVASMKEYIKDRRKLAPRLPDVRKDLFEKLADQMFANLRDLLIRCTRGEFKARLLVHVNQGNSVEFEFDSARDESIAATIALIDRLAQNRDCA